MANRITLADVAQAAGVSVATVDRVLNGRHKVRTVTAERVYEAASELGYYAANVIRTRLQQHQSQYRLGILLQRPRHAFYQKLAQTLERYVEQNASLGIRLDIEFLESQIPSEVAAHMHRMAQRVQALAVTTIDHAIIANAVSELREQHVPVFALLTDTAESARAAYIGLDNRKAGRTAAWMLSRLAKRAGKVAIFVGSHRFVGQELREIGFRTYFREHAPEFEVLDTLINLEVRQITYEVTLELLSHHPDLVGFYIAGGGMEGAIAALRDEQRGGEVVAICNELTPESHAGLADNTITMVIATPLEQLAQQLIEQMHQMVADRSAATSGSLGHPERSFLDFRVYVSENI